MSTFYDQHGNTYYEDNTGCFQKLGIVAYSGVGIYVCKLIFDATQSLAIGFLSFVGLWVLTYIIRSKLHGPAMKIFNIVGIILFIVIVIYVAFFLYDIQSRHNFRFN